MNSIRLVQISHPKRGRRVALIEEPDLRLVEGIATVFGLVWEALEQGCSLEERLSSSVSIESVDYDAVYAGEGEWKLLAPIDHEDPAHCLVSGTGLTHLGSARSRHEMHEQVLAATESLTDSMRIYLAGVEGGRPHLGQIGVQPEWFYKGTGSVVVSPGDPLLIQPFALGCGEEAEVAAVYLVGPHGEPVRLGFCNANEFSDHELEGRNYLYLAPSKLCSCSIGPELSVSGEFVNLPGKVAVQRGGSVHWSAEILTGEENMSHSLRNLEHHLFKYPQHRIPGDIHIHFLGADQLSCREGIRLEQGDILEVSWQGLGRPLRNPVEFLPGSERETLVTVL